jgi:hypothetical protein
MQPLVCQVRLRPLHLSNIIYMLLFHTQEAVINIFFYCFFEPAAVKRIGYFKF